MVSFGVTVALHICFRAQWILWGVPKKECIASVPEVALSSIQFLLPIAIWLHHLLHSLCLECSGNILFLEQTCLLFSALILNISELSLVRRGKEAFSLGHGRMHFL